MKISLKLLKNYISFALPDTESLASVIGASLGALEEPPISLGQIYKAIYVARIVKLKPLEGSDHLNLCFIDDGQKLANIERGSDGLIEVVCGAPNVKEGQTVAWLPPGSIVPSTFHGEQLVLDNREIKGQVSHGMLASAKELALSDDHSGILILDDSLKPGDSFSEILELDDVIIDIENKMFTHRPDCFGLLGLAREVSGILNQPFKSPDWYLDSGVPAIDQPEISIQIDNQLPKQVQRFSLLAIGDLKIQPSPIKIQSYLSRLGVRPVNNVVDLTNLIMLETGQPLHAYDLSKLQKLAAGELTLSVRYPLEGESLELINGKTLTPTSETISIAVGDQLVGLGGIMGSQNSEVDESTSAIVLEAATFDMYAIRRSSMSLGIFSEAVTRFTKGQSPLQTTRILKYALKQFQDLIPGTKQLSNVMDNCQLADDVLGRDFLHEAVIIAPQFINERLGTSLKAEEITSLLTNVEFKVEIREENLTVSAPFWRTDIEIKEDIVEEVGRLFGYENIKPKLLKRSVLAITKDKFLETKARLRSLLSAAGANELLTYSFVSRRLIENANQSVDVAIEIANSLSPDLNFYRLSLTPSLLSKVHPNIKAGFDEFALFELGTFHMSSQKNSDNNDLPIEYSSLALVYTSAKPAKGAAYFKAKQFLTYLSEELNIDGVSFAQLDHVEHISEALAEVMKPFDPKRSAVVLKDNKQLGIVGEFNDTVLSRFKITEYCAGFEIATHLFDDSNPKKIYKPISKYPSLKQDLTLKVKEDLLFSDLHDFLLGELEKLAPKDATFSFTPLSIFKPKENDSCINYSFHLEITDHARTLVVDEVNKIIAGLVESAKKQFNADQV